MARPPTSSPTAYFNAIPRFAAAISSELVSIESVHNFEAGHEFEVVLCQLLRRLLPGRYGVCRGYAVTADSQVVGDDIIVFDAHTAGPLRLIGGDLSRKQYVPIESIYAYIEAKHTLELDGDGPSSLRHAAEQVARVKRLPRPERNHGMLPSGLQLDPALVEVGSLLHPRLANPLYGAVIARHVSWGGQRRTPQEAAAAPSLNMSSPKIPDLALPDLVVAGDLLVGLLVANEGTGKTLRLYRGSGESNMRLHAMPGRALAVGLMTLVFALQQIELEPIDWRHVLNEQLRMQT